MEMTLRPAKPEEIKYTYRQSQQIYGQTGCIGFLRGDMDSNGTGFFTSWEDKCSHLKTEAFKAEFDTVINMLRFDERYGHILKNRSCLAAYCYANEKSAFEGSYCREYGFRADTPEYSYIMRLNPNKGDYNLYIYAYKRDYLDRHLKNASKGIRFIAPDYTEKFKIPDGDKIRISFSNDGVIERSCRYIDEYHLEVGSDLYHICQFAELMQNNGNTVIPLRSSLPETCYSVLPGTHDIVLLKKGDSGYYKTDITASNIDEAKEIVEEYNAKCNISKAQAEAMQAGSMFGWEVPGADPNNYDKNGRFIANNHKDRGESR